MAYTVYEEWQMKNPKAVQYYPEEYDYPADYNKIPSTKPNYLPIQNAMKKPKKPSSTVNYVNERKCPIYIHQYHKFPVSSTYNNYSSLNKSSAEKNISVKPKKNHSQLNKSVLDQLEETYWATWKPNKETVANKIRKTKTDEADRFNKNKAYGDTPDTLVKYFATENFDTSTMSFIENTQNDKYKQRLELISSPVMHDIDRHSHKLITTNTQQIQTDGYPLILPKIEEKVESVTSVEIDEKKEENKEVEDIQEILRNIYEGDTIKGKSDSEDDSNPLKHTDSMIINKKKQSEVKEHFQQPKCIKLYKKPGTSTSFVRGGSYPLKSCLKREPVQRGNFKLGAPGSPILVTTSSVGKKTRK